MVVPQPSVPPNVSKRVCALKKKAGLRETFSMERTLREATFEVINLCVGTVTVQYFSSPLRWRPNSMLRGGEERV